MKYLQPSFSSGANSKKYVENWEKIFGAKKKSNKPIEVEETDIIEETEDKND